MEQTLLIKPHVGSTDRTRHSSHSPAIKRSFHYQSKQTSNNQRETRPELHLYVGARTLAKVLQVLPQSQAALKSTTEGLPFAPNTWNHLQLRHTSCFISLLFRTFISGTVQAWNQSQLARRTKLTATVTRQHSSCHGATPFSPSITQRGNKIRTKALPLNSTKQQLPGVSASNNWWMIFKQKISVRYKKFITSRWQCL